MDDLIQGEKKGELMGYFPNGTEDVRVVTVQLREFDHSEEYERDGHKCWRAIYKTVPVKVCGDCVDRCGDACKTGTGPGANADAPIARSAIVNNAPHILGMTGTMPSVTLWSKRHR